MIHRDILTCPNKKIFNTINMLHKIQATGYTLKGMDAVRAMVRGMHLRTTIPHIQSFFVHALQLDVITLRLEAR